MDSAKFWLRLRPATISLLASIGCICTAAAEAQPADSGGGPADLLDGFIASVDDLQADFRQELFDADGNPAEEPSAGQFSLLRPSRFLWHYDTPYEQIVDADGKWLWMYDVDLEQVTRAPISDLDDSPAMLLSGETSVRERYAVAELEPKEGRRWIELRPLDAANQDFELARIGFNGDGIPEALELVDGLRQLTRVTFTDIRVNSGLTATAFEFEPPPGVDVVGAKD